jgi:hypothetical protein
MSEDGQRSQAQPGQIYLFGAAAVAETLSRSSDVDTCVALSRRIVRLLSEALEYFREAQAGIACRAGCHFCCHLRVRVYPHEAIALFRHLGTLPAEVAQQVRERLKANAARLRQAPAGPTPQIACAFLVDGQCSAYEVRPSACAAYHSLSREACEREHQGDAPAGIPVSQALMHLDQGLKAGIENALASKGLPHAQVELQTSVAALLAKPALISRWRSGRDWQRDERGLMTGK